MNTKSISIDCPHCQAFQTLELAGPQNEVDFACGYCKQNISLKNLTQEYLATCPVCADTKFYQHKDFNKKIGLVIFIAGAALVPWTYAISLLVALAIDAALYPFFPWMSVCYNCKTEFRGWPKNTTLDRFNHEVAAHYEYRKK